MHAELQSRGLLRRVLSVRTSEGVFIVEYNGRGCGFEKVIVNGLVAARRSSWRWIVPHIDFAVGSLRASVDVRVWLWLTFRDFRLTIDGSQVYSEQNKASFSIRSLLAATAAIAVGLSWYSYNARWISDRHAFIDAHRECKIQYFLFHPQPEPPGFLGFFNEEPVCAWNSAKLSHKEVAQARRLFPEADIRAFP